MGATCPATIPGAVPGSLFRCLRLAGHSGHCDAGGLAFASTAAERSVLPPPHRTTLYAAFAQDVPVLNVYGFNRRKTFQWEEDRRANGEALPHERIQHVTIRFYVAQLQKHSMPLPPELR